MNKSASSKLETGNIIIAMSSITLYRNILEDRIVKSFRSLIEYLNGGSFSPAVLPDLYCEFFFRLASLKPLMNFKEYVIEKLLSDENPFSLHAELNEFDKIPDVLKAAAKNDLRCLEMIAGVDLSSLRSAVLEKCSGAAACAETPRELPAWDFKRAAGFQPVYVDALQDPVVKILFSSGSWEDWLDDIADFYRRWGCGVFAKYRAFVWERNETGGILKGVDDPDPVMLSDFISYCDERQEIINNTEWFLKGLPANNILLYGDRGTGKSSTVKAIANEYFKEGLRLIEVPKRYLSDYPRIVRMLKNRRLKFIIFVDDLSFEDNEENYTALKAALEGGIESSPRNVVIYATSNRRHLIKEKFSDRAGLQSGSRDEEIRASDTIQEKLSLADRFGMTVVFSSPDKQRYLEIVEGIAAKRGLELDSEYLHREAMKWELWYNQRSPRTAKQFVDWLEGKIKGCSHK